MCVCVHKGTRTHTPALYFSWLIIRGSVGNLVGSVDLEGSKSHRTVYFNKSKVHKLINKASAMRMCSFLDNNRGKVGLFSLMKPQAGARSPAPGSVMAVPSNKGEGDSLRKGITFEC